MSKILLVEDDKNIRMALEDDLTLEGYQISSAADGQQGLLLATKNDFDLIILDLMLPKLNGLEVCKELRRMNKTTPIIMLTAKSQEIDKIIGLELGADDYITKPFSPRELLARIKAILRRTRSSDDNAEIIQFNDIKINFKKYETKKNGKPIYLTALEYALLFFFIKHKNQVMNRNQILDDVWGKDVYVTSRTVDTHVTNLRKKLEDNPAEPKYIISVRGLGYKFVMAEMD